MKKLILLIITLINIEANTLQNAIDKAPPYSTIKLSKGLYRGSITIDKPLSIVAKEGLVSSFLVVGWVVL